MKDDKVLSSMDAAIERLDNGRWTAEARGWLQGACKVNDLRSRIHALLKAGKREKAMRWLGFAQGVSWALGASTVEELKNDSKPDGSSG